jgi:hypothetical protein
VKKGTDQLSTPRTIELQVTPIKALRYLRISGERKAVRVMAHDTDRRKKLHDRIEKNEIRVRNSINSTMALL